MLKKLVMLTVLCLSAASVCFGAVVEGVNVPDTLSVGDAQLVLNGAGVRVKSLGPISKDIYVAGLYLKEKTTDAQKIIAADETMALKIKIVTSLVTSEKFTDHTRDGFKEATNGNTAPIAKEIESFLSAFSDKINDGDLFDIVYTQGVGVQVFKNGGTEPKITVPGMPIKSALFGIWLGDRSEKNLQILAGDLLAKPKS